MCFNVQTHPSTSLAKLLLKAGTTSLYIVYAGLSIVQSARTEIVYKCGVHVTRIDPKYVYVCVCARAVPFDCELWSKL